MLYDTGQDLPRIDVAFARFVALGHRPSQAARLAGYSATVAPRIGWRLLQRPEIAARVAAFRDSAEAVRHRIRALIGAEAPNRPLSDDALVAALRAEGVDIARRTVAKYREALRIPNSAQRRREKAVPA